MLNTRIVHPATIMVVAPTSGGKTTPVRRLIHYSEVMFDEPPEQIFWHYAVPQPWFSEEKKITFIEGLPDVNDLDPKIRQLVVLDDFMSDTNGDVEKMFTTYSHHRNASVIFNSQNLFFKSKNQKSMSLNTQYLFLMKSVRDVTQINILGRQMFPDKKDYLLDAYKKATAEPWGYLLVDLKPNTPDDMRLRSNIFPGETKTYYLPIDK